MRNKNTESLEIEGKTYTREEYVSLPKTDRQALREEALSRSVEATQRLQEAVSLAQDPFRKAQKEALAALQAQPKFAKSYRGRAADLRRESQYIRTEFRREMLAARDALTPTNITYPFDVQNVFSVWEVSCETPYERFERLVSNHDWYYGYSDDNSVWSAGEACGRTITNLLRELLETDEGPAAQLLYNQKCPWLNEDGSQKEDH